MQLSLWTVSVCCLLCVIAVHVTGGGGQGVAKAWGRRRDFELTPSLTGNSTAAGRLGAVLPISRPIFPPGWQVSCNRRRREASCNLATDTWYRFPRHQVQYQLRTAVRQILIYGTLGPGRSRSRNNCRHRRVCCLIYWNFCVQSAVRQLWRHSVLNIILIRAAGKES